MNSKKLYWDNNKQILILNACLFFLFVFFILVPFLFVRYLGFSGVGHFFSDNSMFSIIAVFILFYFIIVGAYYYRIVIDSYTIKVTSYRFILDFFKEKDQIEIPHTMLVDYSFFNRPFSLNKTLMIRVRTISDKIIVKRFNLTFIPNKKVQKISSVLSSVIVNKS